MTQYRNSVNGTVRTSGSLMGYPWIAVPNPNPETEIAVRTADAIMADVGTDAALAADALAAELAREKPRVTLTAKLQKVIADAEAAS